LLGQRYEIIDPYFNDEEFDLDQFTSSITNGESSANDFLKHILHPELLPWPKPSFLLP
jgi:hypothetical protein